MVSEASLWEALEQVHDPHIPISLRRMGMLRSITIDDLGLVRVMLAIPCLGCPAVTMLQEEITEALIEIEGVADVVVEPGWHHKWSRDMLDSQAQNFMRNYGIQL